MPAGAARLALLILVAVLSVRAMNGPAALAWPALLAVAAIPAMLAGAHPILGPLARFAEVVLTWIGVPQPVDVRPRRRTACRPAPAWQPSCRT